MAEQSSLDFLKTYTNDIPEGSNDIVRQGQGGSLEFLRSHMHVPAKPGAPELTQPEARSEAFKGGFGMGVYPEFKGMAKASGIDPERWGTAASLVGTGKVLWEDFQGKPGEATKLYEQSRDEAKERVKAAYEQWPITAVASGEAGATLNPLSRIVKGGSFVSRIINNALIGGTIGGVRADEGHKIQGAVGGAIAGGVTGGVFGRGPRPLTPPPSEAVLANERLDAGAPVGIMSDNTTLNRLYQSARSFPIVSGFFEKPVQKAIGKMETETGNIASGLATGIQPGDRAGVGYGLKSGMADTQAFNVDKANAEFDNLRLTGINAQNKVPMAPHVAQKFLDMINNLQTLQKKLPEDVARTINVVHGGANFDTLKALRNDINKQISYDKEFGGGKQEEYLRQTRDALTDQMEYHVRNSTKAGVTPDKAVGMWKSANESFEQKMDESKELSDLIKKGSAEGLTGKALKWGDARTGDFDSLRKLHSAVSPEQWDNLAAHSVHQMGLNNKNEFSTNIFVNKYNSMSPEARNLMFGTSGTKTRQALDDIAALSEKFNHVGVFQNRSETSHAVMQGGILAAMIEHGENPVNFVMDHMGHVLAPGAAAYLLTRPATAQSMAKLADRWTTAVRSPSIISGRLLNAASKELSQSIGRTIGIPVDPTDLIPHLGTQGNQPKQSLGPPNAQ